MSHTLIYNSGSHVIETKAQGNLTLHEIKEIDREIAQMAVSKNCFSCLNDFREAKIKLSTMDIYNLPKISSDILALAGLNIRAFRVALVAEKDLKDFHFFEDVTSNRGHTAKVFTDIDKAKKWLSYN
jgi:hypothetical protein